ncbi:recombinase family protein [Pelagibacterium mangrovi]|uniref:recombinase family protein n=1 Tax=Pelagibacterium mangrovi TaxID=3119828 RepID=UPI002FC9FC82
MAQRRQHQSGDISPVRKAALYLRVSTTRQAEGEVSIPSQRDQALAYCEREGLSVAAEFIEPGRSATDDRRPAFLEMIDRACDPDHPFDVIIVHAFSRFYRDGAEMELLIRRLRKHGVTVESISQPTREDDPAAQMLRQVIGIFDEYTSKENGRQVTRAMKENARQGFWNGATPPLGYKIIKAERRGHKIKKKLDIDSVEAETVRQIYRLYIDGDRKSGTPPLGIKELAKWLNAHGYTTRKGGAFGVGPVHHILTNTAYVGQWRYNVRNKATGKKSEPADVVDVPVPRIIDDRTFDTVQSKLAANNPRINPARAVSGPILLTGLATCAHCGSGMTQRTGTSSSGRVYSYYTCAGRAQRGPTACKGNSIRMDALDTNVVDALREKLLAPDRLAAMLAAFAERRTQRAAAINERLIGLQQEADSARDKLDRLYKLVEDGAELDDVLRDRIAKLRADHERAKASLERTRVHSGDDTVIDPAKITAFSDLMTGILDSAENPARKAWLRSLISKVEVDADYIRIVGSKDVLNAAVAASANSGENVQKCVPEWRTRHDSNV